MSQEIITTAAANGNADEREEADGIITAAGMVTSRFAKEGEERYALEVQVRRNDNQEIIRVELDLELDDKTDKNGRVFCPFETTCKTLKGLGYQYGDDLSQVDTLVDKPAHLVNTPKWTNGKRYDNWRFSRVTTFVEADEAKARFQDLMKQFRAKRAGVGAVQTAPAAAAPAAPKPSPFAAPTTPAAAPAPAKRANPFG